MMVKKTKIALKNIGHLNPSKIQDYIDAGGYESLRKAVRLDPQFLLSEVKEAGLRGRGGAGFPTGLKKQYTRQSCGECPQIYVVCNADEGEPGTFKDRIILENDPHVLLEGMLIAGYIIGSNAGYIYLRGEYTESISRVAAAIESARSAGLLGDNIFGSDYSFDIDIVIGAGSYLCGEELTLLESLEGNRGYPRIKPPFPAEAGLYNKPTLVNNVETLSHIPAIVEHGSSWYKAMGTEQSPGTKIFTISGRVTTPGYEEVELGLTLGELLHDIAGGMSEGNAFKGALLGGAAGTFVDARFLDVPLAYETYKEHGATLGSGAVVFFSQKDSVVEMLRSILRFFQHESCGKCVPCRIGTVQLLEIAAALKNNRSRLDALVAEAEYMAATSLCPLGQSPILPIKSAAQHFAEELLQ